MIPITMFSAPIVAFLALLVLHGAAGLASSQGPPSGEAALHVHRLIRPHVARALSNSAPGIWVPASRANASAAFGTFRHAQCSSMQLEGVRGSVFAAVHTLDAAAAAHKPLLPLNTSDWVLVGCVIFTVFLAAGGGIGGGGVLVPLLILIGGFSTGAGVALSNITIVGGALANFLCNAPRRHPAQNKPLVDYELILVMEPSTILGALLGSYFNKMLPIWFTTLSLTVLLSFMTVKLLSKALFMFHVETEKRAPHRAPSLPAPARVPSLPAPRRAPSVPTPPQTPVSSQPMPALLQPLLDNREGSESPTWRGPADHPGSPSAHQVAARSFHRLFKLSFKQRQQLEAAGLDFSHPGSLPDDHTLPLDFAYDYSHPELYRSSSPRAVQAQQAVTVPQGVAPHRLAAAAGPAPAPAGSLEPGGGGWAPAAASGLTAALLAQRPAGAEHLAPAADAPAPPSLAQPQPAGPDAQHPAATPVPAGSPHSQNHDPGSHGAAHPPHASGNEAPAPGVAAAAAAAAARPLTPPPARPRTPELSRQLHILERDEARQVPLEKLAMLVFLAAWTVVSDTLKADMVCGSWQYWAVVLSIVPAIVAVTLWMRRELLLKSAIKDLAEAHTAGEVGWNRQSTLVYPAVCSLAGVIAGMFGVGGGIVKGPLMLEMGVDPQVAAASSSTMILFTSLSASIVYWHWGRLQYDYGAVLLCLGFVVTLAGQLATNHAVKMLGRRSVIVFLMAALMAVASGVMYYQSGVVLDWAVHHPRQAIHIGSICHNSS